MTLRMQRLLGRLYRDKEDGDGADAGGGAAGAGAAGDSAGDGGGGDAGKSGDGGEPAAQTGTAPAADGKTADDGKGANPDGPWGADWRKLLAGDDEAKAKRVGRYADPKAIAESLFQLQDKIAKGELRSTAPLPKDATPEQQAKWRADNGIPESPEKYDLAGLKIDEKDKPIISEFLKAAHGANQTPEQAKATIDWYYAEVARQTEARTDADKAAARAAEDALRAEWGTNNYRGNMQVISNLLATAPESVRDKFMHGRLADGNPIMADPDTVKFLYGLALEINPVASLDIPAGGGMGQGIDAAIAEIEKTMRTDRDAYNRDEKMQARYRELLGAREKLATK